MIKQSKLLKIKSKIPTNLFNKKYGLKLGEFNNTTGTERVKFYFKQHKIIFIMSVQIIYLTHCRAINPGENKTHLSKDENYKLIGIRIIPGDQNLIFFELKNLEKSVRVEPE